MKIMSDLKEFIEYVVKSVVDNPDEVRIKEICGEQAVICELRVDKRDMGKVLVKHGRNVTAIRTLLSAVSSKASKKGLYWKLLNNNTVLKYLIFDIAV
jgi:predicted RNA-binding protein YlqC (UPF0109 family)